MISYSNGNPLVFNQGAAISSMGNVNRIISDRISTNPRTGSVTTRILPGLGNVFLGIPSTYPAFGAGSPVNDTGAQVADRVLNSSLSGDILTGKYDLRRYRGLNLANGAYNNPYNTDPGYGSAYSFSNQYPDGNYFPYFGQTPYRFAGPNNTPDYDNYGQAIFTGLPLVVPDAARGFNIDTNRGFDCTLITGTMPDAFRGYTIDPCTGYSQCPQRGGLSNAFGGDITNPYRGLDFNPKTGYQLGPNPCGGTGSPYGAGSVIGSTPFLNSPYGISQYSEPYRGVYPSQFGISNNPFSPSNINNPYSSLGINYPFPSPTTNNPYLSPSSYGWAGGCKSCR